MTAHQLVIGVMKKRDNAVQVETVSSLMMAVIAIGCMLTILIALSGLTQAMVLRDWLGTLAIMATLTIASNQVIHSICEIKFLSGIDGLGKALTKTVAPFAAVVVAIVVSDQHSAWGAFGFAPFTAAAWATLINRWKRRRKL